MGKSLFRRSLGVFSGHGESPDRETFRQRSFLCGMSLTPECRARKLLKVRSYYNRPSSFLSRLKPCKSLKHRTTDMGKFHAQYFAKTRLTFFRGHALEQEITRHYQGQNILTGFFREFPFETKSTFSPPGQVSSILNGNIFFNSKVVFLLKVYLQIYQLVISILYLL